MDKDPKLQAQPQAPESSVPSKKVKAAGRAQPQGNEEDEKETKKDKKDEDKPNIPPQSSWLEVLFGLSDARAIRNAFITAGRNEYFQRFNADDEAFGDLYKVWAQQKENKASLLRPQQFSSSMKLDSSLNVLLTYRTSIEFYMNK